MPEYNTSRPHLKLREYGRNVQKLVDFIKTIEDKKKRSEAAEVLTHLMKQVSPSIAETTDNEQKFWDDLHIMADFDLDIDSPYPAPEREILTKKPRKVGYASNDIKFKHYGKNIELMIKKATELETKEEREAATIYIGKLMKSFYSTWNKDNINDQAILNHISKLSGDQLELDLEKMEDENPFAKLYKDKPRNKRTKGGSGGRRSGGGNRRSGGGGRSHRRRG